MNADTLPAAHGPRRTTWPADGAERAIVTGTRRRRRRHAVSGAATLACVAAVGTGAVTLDGGPDRPRYDAGGRHGSVTRRMTADPAACAARQEGLSPHVADNGYCVFLTGPRSVTLGEAETFTFRLCRRTGLDVDTVGFASPFEVSVSAGPNPGAGIVRRWGVGSGYHEWHDVVFTGGECREWSFEWSGEDDTGAGVPSGRYDLFASTWPLAWEPEQKPNGSPGAMAVLRVSVLDRGGR